MYIERKNQMKLITATKTLKLQNSYKDQENNIMFFDFFTTDYSLDELKTIFSIKDDISVLYKFTDSDVLIAELVNFTELVMSGTKTILIVENESRTIQVENNGEITETIVDVPVEKECEVFTIGLKYHDPIIDIIKQNRADIDYLALMTETDL